MIKTYRIFSIVCYDESENLFFGDILGNIKLNDFKYFYIKHNKDDNKVHYHVVLYFEKPTTIDYVAKRLLIDKNYIKIQDDFGKRYTLKSSVGYLLHYNNKEKYNYSYEDIHSNIQDTIKKYYDILTGGNNESNELKEILLYIENNDIQYITNVLIYCTENNLLKTFRKYAYILNQIVHENR